MITLTTLRNCNTAYSIILIHEDYMSKVPVYNLYK